MRHFIFLIVLAMFTSALAKETQILIGGEFGQSKQEWKDHTGEWESSFGLRLGAETKDSRIYLSYNYQETKDLLKDLYGVESTFESHILVMNFDAKTNQYYGFFRGFAGINVGAIYSKWTLPTEQDSTNLIYGGQAGLIIDLSKNIYLESGFKYSFTNSEDDDINPSNIMNYYGALNFKF